MYRNFSLTLMVNRACNLRCTYCYTGDKRYASMPDAIGECAIDRAVASVSRGGTLELGFFGGEPMLEARKIRHFIDYAQLRTEAEEKHLTIGLTTNGTIVTPEAWSLMTSPDVELAVSHDGLPAVHDAHRRAADGRETSDLVLATMRGLFEAGKDFRVISVVRPDTVEFLVSGVCFLERFGVCAISPTLDVWAEWAESDMARLEESLALLAEVWRKGLPEYSISWFDEKAAILMRLSMNPLARCQFGCGEVAVGPSGDLYPCERLIGDDGKENPMRLPGNARTGVSFLNFPPAPVRASVACSDCPIRAVCNTTCRCSNYLRSGRVDRPDSLLCLLNKVCVREVLRQLRKVQPKETVAHAG